MERIISVMRSQAGKTFLLLLSFLSLLILTPFVSASLRSSYLYFVFNLLIILLALEAGLLASISKPPLDVDTKKPPPPPSSLAYPSSSSSSTEKLHNDYRISTHEAVVTMGEPLQKQQQQQLLLQVEKSKKKKMVAAAAAADERVQRLRRCRSKPSIFFIGSCEEEEEDRQQQQEAVQVAAEECVGDLMSKQELFMKAETFIGNFYKQLKKQRRGDQSWREHSWGALS